ncbi:MAG: hypothetical protein ACU836_16850 [Gammaproteobacteria bacterium]
MKTATRLSQYLLFSGLLAATSIITWYVTSETNEPESERVLATKQQDAGENGKLSVLDQRLTRLTDSMAQLEGRLQNGPSGGQTLNSASKLEAEYSETDQLDAVDPDEQQRIDLAEYAQRYKEHISELEAQLRSEPEDAKWSEKVSNDVQSAFEKSDQYTFRNLSCKRTLCKLEANLVQSEADRDRASMTNGPGIDHFLHGALGWKGRTEFAVNTETGEVVVYLMHEDSEDFGV